MTNIYQTAYDLINQYIFGNLATIGTYQDLMCVIGATSACAFMVALPFVVVKWVLRALCGSLRGL